MSGDNQRADVLIVGAGVSGGVAAKHLAENGYSVVALEQGRWPSQSDFPGTKPEYELLGLKQWHPSPTVRGRAEDYPVDESESDLPPLWMYSGVGGSSTLYGAIWVRPLPSDFRVRTMDGVADDWPVGYDELLPFYEATDLEMGASGLGGNPAYPPGSPPPLPPHPIGRSGRRMAQAMNRLGWHWWPGCSATPSRDHGNQKQCVRYGVCVTGCPEGAKATTDITHWPVAQRHGARVVTGARVREITLDERGRASGAVYVDRDGNEQFQGASVVLVAANGIGTPRLLLLSESARFPNGLANSSGLVGKNLMLHPTAMVVGTYDEDLEDWRGPSGEKINSMQFYETDASRGFVRGCKWLLWDGAGPLLAALRRTLGEGVRDEPFWGEPFARTMRETAGRTISWGLICEDLPEETNRVVLDPVLRDADGLPAPKVIYRLSENTKRIDAFNCERALELHREAGATKAWVFSRYGSSGHMLGTARMGDDPERSVVDRFGRSHDVENLYLIDGSTFVTGFACNPTSTISALARRTAAHLVANRREQVVAAGSA